MLLVSLDGTEKQDKTKSHLKDVLLGEVKEPTHQYHHHHPFGGGSQTQGLVHVRHLLYARMAHLVKNIF